MEKQTIALLRGLPWEPLSVEEKITIRGVLETAIKAPIAMAMQIEPEAESGAGLLEPTA